MPHPPIFVPSQGSAETLQWAAQHRYPLACTFVPMERLKQFYEEGKLLEAQRLEQLGKELAPDADIAILLSGATVAAAGVEGACQALGARHIRGRDETVQVLQLS